MSREIWKDIPGYEGFYQASNIGRIRSCNRYISAFNGKGMCVKDVKGIMKILTLNEDGYFQVTLSMKGIRKTCSVNRLVYTAFKGNVSLDKDVDHIDGCRTNNCLENLQAVSHRLNTLKSFRLNKTKTTGTSYDKKGKKFLAYLTINYKRIYTGRFDTQAQATKARKKAEKEYEFYSTLETIKT